MCIKFSWPLRELLWVLFHFQLTFWILTLLYVDAVVSISWMILMQQLACGTLKKNIKKYKYVNTAYVCFCVETWSQFGQFSNPTHKTKYKSLLILISKHKIMRFHKFAPR